MPYIDNPPTIPLESIEWEPTGDEDDVNARLSAHIRIGPCDMHIEALAVECDPSNFQTVSASSFRQEIVEALYADNDVSQFRTVQINGREYLFYITPFAA